MRIGVVGFGAAGNAFIDHIKTHSGFQWIAFAESNDSIRKEISNKYQIQGYSNLTEMLFCERLDALYIATPTETHAHLAEEAANKGLHVLVEKPIASSMADARRMVDAAKKNEVVLLVGHSHSYDLPIKSMKEIIDSGELGKVAMVNTWCYTDWVYRPRRPEEFDSNLGGGVIFRQGSHQFDILRLLCGGIAHSVRARLFDWDENRSVNGAHSVWIDFEGGAVATAIYSGYGRFNSSELCGNVGEWGVPVNIESFSRRVPKEKLNQEQELLGKRQRSKDGIPSSAPHQPFFGLTVVSCEFGDIRQSPQGLYVYNQDGMREVLLPLNQSPRYLVLNELYAAIENPKTAFHTGSWGLANLEICFAALRSSQINKTQFLAEQNSNL